MPLAPHTTVRCVGPISQTPSRNLVLEGLSPRESISARPPLSNPARPQCHYRCHFPAAPSIYTIYGMSICGAIKVGRILNVCHIGRKCSGIAGCSVFCFKTCWCGSLRCRIRGRLLRLGIRIWLSLQDCSSSKYTTCRSLSR
jgi:hypothetical protein